MSWNILDKHATKIACFSFRVWLFVEKLDLWDLKYFNIFDEKEKLKPFCKTLWKRDENAFTYSYPRNHVFRTLTHAISLDAL